MPAVPVDQVDEGDEEEVVVWERIRNLRGHKGAGRGRAGVGRELRGGKNMGVFDLSQDCRRGNITADENSSTLNNLWQMRHGPERSTPAKQKPDTDKMHGQVLKREG